MKTSKGVYFEEIQHYKSAWFWLVCFAAAMIIFGYLIINFDKFENNDYTGPGLYVMAAIIGSLFLFLYWLFTYMHMDLRITNRGIEYKYPPFLNKYEIVENADIASFKLVKYKPLQDYGGWGFRKVTRKKKVCFSVKGYYGLHVITKQKVDVMFGTQRKEAMQTALNKLNTFID